MSRPSVPANMPQPSMLELVLINLFLGMLWRAFVPFTGVIDYGIGILIGLVVMGLLNREYGIRVFRVILFVGYVLRKIVSANIALAWIIIQPQKRMKARLNPAIVAVPLSVSGSLEIMLLASVITLTPGTISVDLGKDEAGDQVLYVHCLQFRDKQQFQDDIKDGFERRILGFTRGLAS